MAAARPATALFHPYLFGSPFGAARRCAQASRSASTPRRRRARALVKDAASCTPDPRRQAELDRRYAVFLRLAEALAPVWPDIEALGEAAS